MYKVLFLVFLTFHLSSEVVSATNVNANGYLYAAAFLKDFLSNDDQISHVIGYLCWNTDFYVKLIKTLSAEGYTTTVHTSCTKKNIYEIEKNRILYVLDTSCDFAEKCLNLANERKLFKFPFKWIVMEGFGRETDGFQLAVTDDRLLSDSKNNADIALAMETDCDGGNVETLQLKKCPITFITNLTLLVDSEVVIARRRPQFQNILLFNIFRRKNLLKSVWENFGYWNKKNGLVDTRISRITSVRRLNLQKTELIVSVVVLNPTSIDHMIYDEYNRVDTLSKVNYVLATHLVDFLNGTTTYIFESNWGAKLPNGSYFGMLEQLIKKKSDIGSTPMFFVASRLDAVDFISMTTKTTAFFIFREPPLSSVSNIFVLPFEWTVWVTVILFVMLSCMALYFTNMYEDNLIKKFTNEKTDMFYKQEDSKTSVEFGDVCLIAIGAVAQQGSVIEPRSISGRIVSIMLFFTLMFLYVSYSANIVSLLQSQSNNIKTLSDLLHSKLKLGSEDNLYNRYYFKMYQDPVRKAIWDQKMSPKGEKPHFYTLEDGVKLMQKGLFAFHMESGVGYKFVNDLYQEDEKCGLQEILYFEPMLPWFSIQKNSSFLEMFKIGMRRIHESGLQSRENHRFYTKKPICTSSATFVSVGLIDIRPALIFLGCGISVAVTIFILEIFVKYRSVVMNKIRGRLM